MVTMKLVLLEALNFIISHWNKQIQSDRVGFSGVLA